MMLNKVAVFFLLVIAGVIGVHQALNSGALLRYLDAHPNPAYVPKAEYYIGYAYYVIQDLDQATTYFLRASQRYPKSPVAAPAYFAYINCLEDSPAASRATLIDEYQKYLTQFPNGQSASVARSRMDDYKTGAR